MDEAFFGPGGPAGTTNGADRTGDAPVETFRAKLVFSDQSDSRFGQRKWIDVPLPDDGPPWILRIPHAHDGHVDVFERQELSTTTLDVEYDHIGTTPPT